MRWSLWILAAPLAVGLLFALVNIGAGAAFLVKVKQTDRIVRDIRRLNLSGASARSVDEAARRYRALYAARIGPDPQPADIRRHLEGELTAGGPAVLDQALIDYIVSRWGAIDGRSLPAGVYVGARAIGPDTPPLSHVTKYLGQYALYVRHGYVLVVEAAEETATPVEFSASRASDFSAGAPDPHDLMIRPEPFRPGAYDFPGQGQAVHELFRLSADPRVIAATGPELRAIAQPLRAAGARYEVFGQNSNTVLACMLRVSELHRSAFEPLRRDPLLKLRLLGISEPLWSQPGRRPADTRCN